MGDSNGTDFAPSFNGSLQVEGRPEKLTRHAGLVLLRELDERLGLTADLAAQLVDERAPCRIQHSLTQLLRTATYAMAIDSAHASAAAGMGGDAMFKITTSDKKGLSMLDDENATASQPTISRLFAQLSSEANLPTLRIALFDSAVRAVHAIEGTRLDQVTLDIDSYPIEVHGQQAGSEYNGYYRVRGDAGYVGPEILAMLDEKEVPYAIRLPVNSLLQEYVELNSVRPPGRPPTYERIWCYDIEYRALTWKEARRVVQVVVETPGELFLKTFFIVTSFSKDELCDRDVLDYYRERGTMEGHIGETKDVIDGSLSSTNRKKALYRRQPVADHAEPIDPERVNAAALCMHALAFNLLNTFRILAGASDYVDEPPELGLERARQLLLVAGRIVVSARRATLIVMDGALEAWERACARLKGLHPPLTIA